MYIGHAMHTLSFPLLRDMKHFCVFFLLIVQVLETLFTAQLEIDYKRRIDYFGFTHVELLKHFLNVHLSSVQFLLLISRLGSALLVSSPLLKKTYSIASSTCQS